MRLRPTHCADEPPDDGVLAETIRALARERYSPPADRLDIGEASIRAAFLTARTSHSGPRGERTPPPRPLRDLRRFVRVWSRAVVLAPALLVILVMGTVLASTESAPGHPLFAARLAVEQALLPQHSTAARLAAELDRLDRRVTEAAAATGDVDATREATEAYRETLGEVVDLVRAEPAQRGLVERALDGQITELRALAARSDAASKASLGSAADAASSAEHALSDHGPGRRHDTHRRTTGSSGHETIEPTPAPPSE